MRKISTATLFFVCLCISSVAFAQTTTNSPYSKYGVGVIRPQSFSQNFGMGGTAIGLRSNLNINSKNPASYSDLLVTTIEFNFMNNSLWLDDGTQSQYKTNPYVASLALAFPVIQKTWGMSFGLMPVTSIGYDYTNNYTDENVGSVTEIRKGEGGLNKFYFGNGFNVKLDSSSNLAFGANANFYFGRSEFDSKTIFGNLSQGLNIWDLSESTTSDFSFDFGTQYQKNFSKYDSTSLAKETYVLTVGATVGLAKELSTKQNRIVRSFTGSSDFGTIKDTILETNNSEQSIDMPLEYGVGFSFEKKNKWIIAFDYNISDWTTIASTNPLYSYNKVQSFAAGYQITPKYDDYVGSYFKRIAYRFGFRYSNSYFSINDNQLNEYGITFGTGLPLRRTGTSAPTLNLGIEYGKRGATTDGLIQETFINFNVGIIINDKWFIKRKYN